MFPNFIKVIGKCRHEGVKNADLYKDLLKNAVSQEPSTCISFAQ